MKIILRKVTSEHEIDLVALLKSCAKQKNLSKGAKLHTYITLMKGSWLRENVYIGSALVNMYAKCGDLEKAQKVFDELPSRNVVSWNALIGGYVQEGYHEKGLLVYENMRREGFCPNVVSFTCSLKACGGLGALETGTRIHAEIVISQERSLMKNYMLGTSLVQMYAKCGVLSNAQQVFDELPIRDVITWTTLISGFCLHGHNVKALSCFYLMRHEGLSPDAATFACVLKVCGKIGSIKKTNEMHAEIVRGGLMENDTILRTALMDMYAQCDDINMARQVFDEIAIRNVVCWTVLICAYSQNDNAEEALKCLERMQCEGFSPDDVTFICALKACRSIGSIEKGQKIHARIRNLLLHEKINIATALVDMYSQCGALVQAQKLFDSLKASERNLASWTALIAGYSKSGRGEHAINCFVRMQREGLLPDAAAFTCTLKACGNMRDLGMGKEIYHKVKSARFLENNIVLCTSVIDMLAKCGAFTKAREVLELLPYRNLISWSALISGYAQQGHVSEALNCFEQMESEGVSPDDVTFLCVLNACSHSGQLDEAQMLFRNMTRQYGIIPNLEHFTCMMVVFGGLGYVDDAILMMKVMPSSHDVAVWVALLTASRKWGNMMLAKLAFEETVQLCDSSHGSLYVCD